MNCSHVPNSPQLLKDFGAHEITTVYDLMSCMHGEPSNFNFKRIVLLMLRGHYSSPLNNPRDLAHLDCYTWRPADEDGKEGLLTVDYTHVYDDAKPDRVPGIYVGFGGMSEGKLALGDHHSHSEDRSVENFVSDGKLTIEVHHITASPGDSADLAEVSSLFLRAMARVVRGTTGARGFRVLGYAKPGKNKLSNTTTNYEVVLSLEISYTLGAALSEETHRIKSISGVIASAT